MIVGVDGCRAGWVVARQDPGAPCPTLQVVTRFDAVLAALPDMARVAVDMPIGLLDVPRPGGRACDIAARQALPPSRKSSVFSPPGRRALDATGYADAQRANGAGLSLQAFHLLPRMREVDAVLTPALQARVFEAHPELAFLRLGSGDVPPPKRSAAGRDWRRTALASVWGESLTAVVDAALAATRRTQAQPDDLLDALVLVIVAAHAVAGTVRVLPPTPTAERDARGLAMQIRC